MANWPFKLGYLVIRQKKKSAIMLNVQVTEHQESTMTALD